MVREFFEWWGEQLASLVPERLRRSLTGAERRLVLIFDPPCEGAGYNSSQGVLDVRLQRNNHLGLLGRFHLDASGLDSLRAVIERSGPGLDIVLQLPHALILNKRITLPLAAQRDLARVVAYQIDQETPFLPSEIYWSVAPEQRDRALGQLTAQLGVVLKNDADPLLQRLRQAGIKPAAMTGTDSPFRIRLQPKRDFRGFLTNPALFGRLPILSALCVLLALAALTGPFLRQSWALADVQEAIAALQPDADAAVTLRRQIGGATPDLGDPQTAVGNPLLVLAALTDALPDDTSLTDLTMHHGQVALIGQSGDAAALIARLSDTPVLKDPGFSAPVTREAGADSDSFALNVMVAAP